MSDCGDNNAGGGESVGGFDGGVYSGDWACDVASADTNDFHYGKYIRKKTRKFRKTFCIQVKNLFDKISIKCFKFSSTHKAKITTLQSKSYTFV